MLVRVRLLKPFATTIIHLRARLLLSTLALLRAPELDLRLLLSIERTGTLVTLEAVINHGAESARRVESLLFMCLNQLFLRNYSSLPSHLVFEEELISLLKTRAARGSIGIMRTFHCG